VLYCAVLDEFVAVERAVVEAAVAVASGVVGVVLRADVLPVGAVLIPFGHEKVFGLRVAARGHGPVLIDGFVLVVARADAVHGLNLIGCVAAVVRVDAELLGVLVQLQELLGVESGIAQVVVHDEREIVLVVEGIVVAVVVVWIGFVVVVWIA